MRLKNKDRDDQWPKSLAKPCRTEGCESLRAWGRSRCWDCVRRSYYSRKLKLKARRKRPGSAPNRGAGWQRARKAVSGQPCAICGAKPSCYQQTLSPGRRAIGHPVDHILAARFIEQHNLGDPHARVNLVTLCAKCHPLKRRAEDRLCNRTNIIRWLQELNRIGFPMGLVRKAMEFYGIGRRSGVPGGTQ